MTFASAHMALIPNTFPKLTSRIEESIIDKLTAQNARLSSFIDPHGNNRVLYSRKVGYFLQVLDFEPMVLDGNGQRRPPSEFKEMLFGSELNARLALCCLNSNLFYWFITVFSDCRHVNKREVNAFPINIIDLGESSERDKLDCLGKELMESILANSVEKKMRFSHDELTVQCIIPKLSKKIINQIDLALGKYYGFTDEELDFIINYDIKYRMGLSGEEGE